MDYIESNKTHVLTPLKYHSDICDHLKKQEQGLWAWFASDAYTEKHVEYQKLELLKSTIRLNPESNAHLYTLAEKARNALAIDLPLTLYQAQSSVEGLNAALIFLPDEIAIILQGDIRSKLNESELLAVFAHEIAHHKLYAIDNGDYFTAMRILHWCCSQPDCAPPFYETDRRYQLFTEVYADLGALQVLGEWKTAVSSLIKVSTGLNEVSVDDYLTQADEVLTQLEAGSKGISHPETFLRAKVLHTVEKGGEWYADIAQMLTGNLDVTCMDLLDQITLTQVSEDIIKAMLSNPIMQTDTLETSAQQYFPETNWSSLTSVDIDKVQAIIKESKEKTLNYLSYVLLDLATADEDTQPISLIIALQLAKTLEIDKVFEPVLRKELKKKKADIKNLLDNAQEKIDEANNAHSH